MADTQACASGEPEMEVWSQESRQSCKYDTKVNCFGLGAIELSAALFGAGFLGELPSFGVGPLAWSNANPARGALFWIVFSLARLPDSVCENFIVYIVG